MIWQTLLRLSQNKPLPVETTQIRNFKSGGEWMQAELGRLAVTAFTEVSPTDYSRAGLFKYGLASLTSVLVILLGPSQIWLKIPVAVSVFYVVEAHFLFLFPLLASNHPKPYRTSVKLTYRIGLFRCVVNILPIAIFMLAGLIRGEAPLRNWYIGCRAILIWYLDETEFWLRTC